MRFNRKAVNFGGVRMPLGPHKVKFANVEAKTTQSGKGMITYNLVGDGASIPQNLVDQGKDTFKNGDNINEANMNRILGSAFDAGVEIPDKEWNFKMLYQFLHAKLPEVYVLVKKQKNNEQYNEAIFISKEQYEAELKEQKGNDVFGSDDSEETPDPFAEDSGTEVSDDDFEDGLPF